MYDLCPLLNPNVVFSVLACGVEHTSFNFGLSGHKFVLCLFGQGPGICTICRISQHTGVAHLSVQADGNVGVWHLPPSLS